MYVLEEVTTFFYNNEFKLFQIQWHIHMLNVNKIIVKDQEALDSWATDEISVAEISFWKYLEYVPVILRNCKKIKRRKTVGSTISRFLSAY